MSSVSTALSMECSAVIPRIIAEEDLSSCFTQIRNWAWLACCIYKKGYEKLLLCQFSRHVRFIYASSFTTYLVISCVTLFIITEMFGFVVFRFFIDKYTALNFSFASHVYNYQSVKNNVLRLIARIHFF